jgi:hypothetical protein
MILQGFPDHPHRGQATVTYIFQGASKHEDSAGHAGIIREGGVQWMCAVRALWHSMSDATGDDATDNATVTVDEILDELLDNIIQAYGSSARDVYAAILSPGLARLSIDEALRGLTLDSLCDGFTTYGFAESKDVTGGGHKTLSHVCTNVKSLRDERGIQADTSPTCVTEVGMKRREYIVPKDRRDSTWSLRDSK